MVVDRIWRGQVISLGGVLYVVEAVEVTLDPGFLQRYPRKAKLRRMVDVERTLYLRRGIARYRRKGQAVYSAYVFDDGHCSKVSQIG